MAKATDFVLHNVSVVITAQTHNPSILNPDFLLRVGIVPEDWDAIEALTTPGLSRVAFANGVSWQVDENRCEIRQRIERQFEQKYLVHGLSNSYIKALPHVPYRAIGLNWVFHLAKRGPAKWLRGRFLKPGKWLESKPPVGLSECKFSLRMKDCKLFLKLSPQTVQLPNQDKEEAVVVDSNFHFRGPFQEVKAIQDIIDSWEERQEALRSIATKLLRARSL